MSEKNMRERVLATIEAQQVVPKSRWHFLLREGVVWGAAAGAFVLGSIASALSIYIADSSRFMERIIELSPLDIVFEVIPILWITLAIGALFYTVHAVRGTRRGYRLPTTWLVLAALIASVGTGFLFHAHGLSAALDRYLLEAVPLYPSVSGFHSAHWMHPREGVIAGTVVRADPTGMDCILSDLAGKTWTVRIATSSSESAHIFREGSMVRVFGTTTSEEVFEAIEVRPFRGRGGMRSRPGMMLRDATP